MTLARIVAHLANRFLGPALAGSRGPLSETRAFHHRDGAEDYLVGMSDMDARWYCERKSWGS